MASVANVFAAPVTATMLNYQKRRTELVHGKQRSRDMDVRAGAEAEIQHLSKVWHAGWHDAHAQIVPAELTSPRTLESFAERLHAALRDVRVLARSVRPLDFAS
jgi:hypothetical protein